MRLCQQNIYICSVLSLLLFLFLYIPSARASVIYEQTFDSLNLGDLNTQDNWNGDTSFDVQDTVVNEGTKALIGSGTSEQTINRYFASSTAGTFCFQFRTNTTTVDEGGGIRLNENSATRLWYLFTSGKVRYWDDDLADYQDYSNISANTWYYGAIQWNDASQNDKYRIRISSDGSTWSDWSSWAKVKNGILNFVDRIYLHTFSTGDSVNIYLDDFYMSTDDCTEPPEEEEATSTPAVLPIRNAFMNCIDSATGTDCVISYQPEIYFLDYILVAGVIILLLFVLLAYHIWL